MFHVTFSYLNLSARVRETGRQKERQIERGEKNLPFISIYLNPKITPNNFRFKLSLFQIYFLRPLRYLFVKRGIAKPRNISLESYFRSLNPTRTLVTHLLVLFGCTESWDTFNLILERLSPGLRIRFSKYGRIRTGLKSRRDRTYHQISLWNQTFLEVFTDQSYI